MTRPWMPIYWGDYTKKTQHLSTLEHGAYLLLIAHYWNTGEPIQDSDDVLRRITRTTSKQWNQIAKTIRGFFIPEDGLLIHERVEKELQTSRGVSTLQSSKAQQRWKNEEKQEKQVCRGNAVAMPITITTTIKKKDIQKPDLVSDEVWGDFLILRRGKKAPVTDTVVAMISNEAKKAGITIEEALAETCARGWQSFKAEWYNKPSQFEKPKPQRAGVKTL